eukprot:Cvel_838.t1-p1 / transcript=Cvel_838.t1 / gene=Cvel_838 / organism=Chromera_velia_CCMP2878 / gene_product=hypothetical protein / transcript_product=hypothetical protein / location=Cvel_scaffold26:50826-53135(-) / protein_length=770 / sequence_SO=supercontig / SO=protein_coding / is_pseudo=false
MPIAPSTSSTSPRTSSHFPPTPDPHSPPRIFPKASPPLKVTPSTIHSTPVHRPPPSPSGTVSLAVSAAVATPPPPMENPPEPVPRPPAAPRPSPHADTMPFNPPPSSDQKIQKRESDPRNPSQKRLSPRHMIIQLQQCTTSKTTSHPTTAAPLQHSTTHQEPAVPCRSEHRDPIPPNPPLQQGHCSISTGSPHLPLQPPPHRPLPLFPSMRPVSSASTHTQPPSAPLPLMSADPAGLPSTNSTPNLGQPSPAESQSCEQKASESLQQQSLNITPNPQGGSEDPCRAYLLPSSPPPRPRRLPFNSDDIPDSHPRGTKESPHSPQPPPDPHPSSPPSHPSHSPAPGEEFSHHRGTLPLNVTCGPTPETDFSPITFAPHQSECAASRLPHQIPHMTSTEEAQTDRNHNPLSTNTENHLTCRHTARGGNVTPGPAPASSSSYANFVPPSAPVFQNLRAFSSAQSLLNRSSTSSSVAPPCAPSTSTIVTSRISPPALLQPSRRRLLVFSREAPPSLSGGSKWTDRQNPHDFFLSDDNSGQMQKKTGGTVEGQERRESVPPFRRLSQSPAEPTPTISLRSPEGDEVRLCESLSLRGIASCCTNTNLLEGPETPRWEAAGSCSQGGSVASVCVSLGDHLHIESEGRVIGVGEERSCSSQRTEERETCTETLERKKRDLREMRGRGLRESSTAMHPFPSRTVNDDPPTSLASGGARLLPDLSSPSPSSAPPYTIGTERPSPPPNWRTEGDKGHEDIRRRLSKVQADMRKSVECIHCKK